MIVDFAGCWIIEVGCKYFFADLQPKSMVTKGRERREERRRLQDADSASQVVEAVSQKKHQ
jgi:cation-transporting ATPase 13A1